MADGIDAKVEGRRIIVQAPPSPGVLQIAYTVTNGRGGRDSAVLTVNVLEDAPVLPPVARDVVVPAIDTLGRESVEVDVLAVAQNPSGPLSDLEVSVPDSAAGVASVTPTGSVVITLGEHAQTVPYLLANSTANIIAPIRSRTLLVRVAAPSHAQICQVLAASAKREGWPVVRGLHQRIAEESGRNLRKALLMYEAVHAQK